MILENKEGQQTFSIDEIYDVKVREFSFLKSAGLICFNTHYHKCLILCFSNSGRW